MTQNNIRSNNDSGKRTNNNEQYSSSLGALTKLEASIIKGGLLGDDHLHRRASDNCRVKVAHKLAHADYVWWKRKNLSRLCGTTQDPQVKTDRYGYQRLQFETATLGVLTPIHDQFYAWGPKPKVKGGEGWVKVIKPEMVENLGKNPHVLAVWYLDDGSVRTDCYAARIATHGFSKEGCGLLQQYLKEQWNLKSTIAAHTTKSGQFTINLAASTFGDFIDIIEPIVQELPVFTYKLNIERKAGHREPRND